MSKLRLTGTQKLQVVLSGAATASRVTVSYMDFTATGVTGGTVLTVTNGTTPVDICGAPAASTTRQIDHIKLVAKAAMTPTFSVNDGTAEEWDTVTLASGDVYEWAADGAVVKDSGGNRKTIMPSYLQLTGGTLSGLATFNAGATVASGQTLTLTGATVAGAPTWSSSQAITLSTAAQPNVTSLGTLTGLSVVSASSNTLVVGSATGQNSVLSFNINAVAQGYLGVAGANDALVTGSIAGDSLIRTNGKNFGVSVDSGASLAFKIATTGAASFGSNSLTAGAISGTTGAFSSTLQAKGITTVSVGTQYPLLITDAPSSGTRDMLRFETLVAGAGAGIDAVTTAQGAYTPLVLRGSTISLKYQNTDVAVVSSTGLSVAGDISVSTKTPANASAAGVAGTITWDASYIYVATATNTWKRVGIATW